MAQILKSSRMAPIRCDIRGPIEAESIRLQKQGIKILPLNTGNPATFGFSAPDVVLEAMEKNVRSAQAQAYCSTPGLPQAREAVARNAVLRKGIKGVTADDIYMGNGASEIIELALLALLSPGDEVLVPMPDYPLWTGATQLASGNPVHYLCDESNGWLPDLDDIRSKVTNRTKAIVIINPNNPTGVVYPRETLEGILEIAREHGLLVFSDEIYDRLLYDGAKHIATASLCDDLFIITLGGLSKSHYLCGYRCGWMIMSGDRSHAQDYLDGLKVIMSLRLCSNVPAQEVVPIAMDETESMEKMLAPGGRLYEQRRVVLEELPKIPGVSVVPNYGAFYVFPKLDERFHITNDEQFALDFLRAKHVMVVNGRGFSWNAPDHFRLVCLPEPEVLRDAIHRLGDFLDGYKQA